MNGTAFKAYGTVALRITLGAVFVYAGVIKARVPDEFRTTLLGYRMIPAAWTLNVAYGLPFFEAIAGFWLFLGWRPRVPALAVALLSLLFTVAVGQALLRGFDIDCGCFGTSGARSGHLWITLIRDALLIGASFWVYRDACTREIP